MEEGNIRSQGSYELLIPEEAAKRRPSTIFRSYGVNKRRKIRKSLEPNLTKSIVIKPQKGAKFAKSEIEIQQYQDVIRKKNLNLDFL